MSHTVIHGSRFEKSHTRFIDYPVTGVGASASKWEAPRKAGGDIVTTSAETQSSKKTGTDQRPVLKILEVDAYTFSKLAGTTGILTGTAADITVGTTDVPGLVDAAAAEMNENEVPEEGRLLFISETAYEGLKNKIARFTENGERSIFNGIETYNGMRVIRVPQNRFYTAITLYDGSTSGQEAGGYIGTTVTGYKINFMILHPSAVLKVMKHVLPRIFTPDVNQAADAWKFDYRAYYDVFAMENKVKGIYLHKGATALA